MNLRVYGSGELAKERARRRRQFVDVLTQARSFDEVDRRLRGYDRTSARLEDGYLFDLIHKDVLMTVPLDPFFRLYLAIFGSGIDSRDIYRGLHAYLKISPTASYTEARGYIAGEVGKILQEQNREFSEEAQQVFNEVMGTLTERERGILQYRFFEGKTLEDAGRPLGLNSRERASQIEARAIRKLRHPDRFGRIRDLFKEQSS